MSKWSRLLDVYEDIECDEWWDSYRKPGIHLVKGDGNETAEAARILVVGEAPGAQENGRGRPFVGPSGLVLGQLLGLAGVTRSMCFLTNVVKYRPAGNRTPSLADTFHAQEALRKEFMIIRPRLTILIGRTAHDAMSPDRGIFNLGTSVHAGIGYYKSIRPSGGGEYSYVRSMYHPAFLMRGPSARKEAAEMAWEEFGNWITEAIPEVRDVV